MRKRTAIRFVKKIDRIIMYRNEKGASESVKRILMNILPFLNGKEEKKLKIVLERCEKTANTHRTARRNLADFFTNLMRCGTAQRTCGSKSSPAQAQVPRNSGKVGPRTENSGTSASRDAQPSVLIRQQAREFEKPDKGDIVLGNR